jgi:hypothetical protein
MDHANQAYRRPEVVLPNECWTLLGKAARTEFCLPVRYGVTLDDVPDDHPCFAGYEAHDDEGDDEGDEELNHLNELERGYAQDRR